MERGFAVAALFVMSACVPSRELLVPAIDARAQAILVAIEGPDGEVDLRAVDGRDVSAALTIRSPATLTVIALERSLRELQLAQGRVSPAAAGAPSRTVAELPGRIVVLTTEIRDAEPGVWRAAETIEGAAADMRMPALDPVACIRENACVRDRACVEECGTPEAPREPARPVPPNWACPAGWEREPLLHGAVACEPLPGAATSSCAFGSARFPGDQTCGLLDTCPLGQYAENLPPGAILVPAGPGELARAIAAAPDGAVLALERGAHDGGFVISRAVELIGGCARDAQIAGAPLIVEARAVIRGLTVPGADVSRPGVSLALRASIVAGGTIRAAANSTVSASRVVMLGPGVNGAVAEDGAHLAFDEVRLEGFSGDGIAVRGQGTTAVLRGIVARGLGSAGISVAGLAEVVIERSVIEDVDRVGLEIKDRARASASDVVVRGVRPEPATGRYGQGVGVHGGARADLSRVWLDRNRARGVWVTDAGSAAHVRDAIVTCTLRESITAEPAGAGTAFDIGGGGEIELLRSVSFGDAGGGLGVISDAANTSRAMVSDFIADGECRGAGIIAKRAIIATNGSSLEVDRVFLEDIGEHGIQIADQFNGRPTHIAVRDAHMRCIGFNAFHLRCVDEEIGMTACDGDTEVERAQIRGAKFGAINHKRTRNVVFRDLDAVVTSTCGGQSGDLDGVGVELADVAELELERFFIRRAVTGLQMLPDTRVTVRDGELRDNRVGLEAPLDGDLLPIFEGLLLSGNESAFSPL